MNLYTFKLEQFHIDNTRSRHQDTDTATFVLQIGGHQFPPQYFFAGDVNNGDHAVNLVFGPVLLNDPDHPAVFSYEIYNGDASKLSSSLAAMADSLVSQMADLTVKQATGNASPGNISSIEPSGDPSTPGQEFDPFADTSDWTQVIYEAILGGIVGFLFPDCDGFAAADAIGRTKSQWDSLIDSAGGATFRKTMRYPGTNSPAGCGSNSDYSVTWSVTREKITGSMRQFLKARGLTLNPGLRSLG
jgi:hypothetical protein